MSQEHIIQQQMDITAFPAVKNHPAQAGYEYTIGDLHGNALKFIHFLSLHDILQITRPDFDLIKRIYTKGVDNLTRADIDLFSEILDRTPINTSALIRLIGDETADRGENDLFILLILDRLARAQAKVEVLWSNHGYEFIKAYESGHFDRTLIRPHAQSMLNLHRLLERQIISRQEIDGLINRAYKPSLKLLSYNLNDDHSEITLFSHAGIGLGTIRSLAQKYGILFEDDTATALASTIDRINHFISNYVNNNTAGTLCTDAMLLQGYGGVSPLSAEHAPIEFILWNRFYDNIRRPERHHGYRVNYAHGHDLHDQDALDSTYLFNLDNYLGKGYNVGYYNILCSRAHQLNQLNAQPNNPVRQPIAQVNINDEINKMYQNLHGPFKNFLTNTLNENFGFVLSDAEKAGYWNDISRTEKEIILKNYQTMLPKPAVAVAAPVVRPPVVPAFDRAKELADTSYQQLPVEFRQELSVWTKNDRMRLNNPPDNETYWTQNPHVRENLARRFLNK